MKILWLTDMGALGSGYKNLSLPLLNGLAEKDWEIKVLGLLYKGEEHNFPFSIIPVEMDTIAVMINNLSHIWSFDYLVVALDIPLQKHILQMCENILSNPEVPRFEYTGIFPLEAEPLITSWARLIMKMKHAFCISQFGTDEIKKKNVSNIHFLPMGVDTVSWKVPTNEERKLLRMSYGIAEDEFVILTVADNQERKFLSRTVEIISDFKKKYGVKIKWILVTRVHLDVGWSISDLVSDYDLIKETLPLERGMGFLELWGLYALSNCFLITSKAEGIGIPVMEAMAVGLPVVATNCTGMKESMDMGGGFPIEYDYQIVDPFGNGNRYYASIEEGARQLKNVYDKQGTKEQVNKGLGFVQTRRWENSVDLFANVLEGKIKNG